MLFILGCLVLFLSFEHMVTLRDLLRRRAGRSMEVVPSAGRLGGGSLISAPYWPSLLLLLFLLPDLAKKRGLRGNVAGRRTLSRNPRVWWRHD